MTKYQKKIYSKYISSGHYSSNTNLSEKKIKKEFDLFNKNLLKHLPDDKNSKILEIGFGSGIFLKYLIEMGFSNFEGVEIGKEQFEFTKKNITNRVHLIKNTVTFLEKKKKYYDIIIMLDVLEHISKDQVLEYLSTIKKSLKTGGKFIFRVPNGSNPYNYFNVYGGDFTHETVFTKKIIKQISGTIGFSSVLVFGQEEEDVSFHGKITNITQKIIFIFLDFFIQLQRLGHEPPFNKCIIGVLKK